MPKDSPLPLHRTVRGRAVLASVLAGMGLVSTGMALLIPVNEYRATLGIQGAYDCDGPDVVATFVVMALAFLLSAALVAAWTLLRALRCRDRSWGKPLAAIALIFALLGISANITRIPAVSAEWTRNNAPNSACH